MFGIPGNPMPLERRQGKMFAMDDDHSPLLMEGALMWFDLTAFSPFTLNAHHYREFHKPCHPSDNHTKL
jgi:hypothetical protein